MSTKTGTEKRLKLIFIVGLFQKNNAYVNMIHLKHAYKLLRTNLFYVPIKNYSVEVYSHSFYTV